MNKYMDIAYKEAKKADIKDEIPVGAVIVKDNKVIAKAHNKRNKSNKIIDHAEILAITKANKKLHNWRLEDCELYITLEPCPMCASAIEQSRIKKIYTSASNNNDSYNKISSDILNNIEWDKNIDSEKSELLIKEFFKKKR
jgi:tRNA(adenine34) deaminase